MPEWAWDDEEEAVPPYIQIYGEDLEGNWYSIGLEYKDSEEREEMRAFATLAVDALRKTGA